MDRTYQAETHSVLVSSSRLARRDWYLHHEGMAELPPWPVMNDAQVGRWEQVLGNLARMLPAGPATVLVDGAQPYARVLADRLAAALDAAGSGAVLTDGPAGREHPPAARPDVTIWLRTPSNRPGDGDPESGADIVVDLHDPCWPVIRHVSGRLAAGRQWYLTEGPAFFAIRAATWDSKFGDDLPAYHRAVAEARLPAGATVIDVGCGTGRALPALRAAVGSKGVVLGADFTPQMLAVARARARTEHASLLLADAHHLPLATASVDAVFAAGLLSHLTDAVAGLAELARITRPGGRLILFHPSGRAALAARHGRALHPDEPLAEAPLRRATGHTGWRLDTYDDPADRFHATATRT